jgi:hypothetical protein
MLLQESRAADSGGTMAASETAAPRAPQVRLTPEEPSAARFANPSATDAASPAKHVDLSGIFRKVQAKSVAGEGPQTAAPIDGTSGRRSDEDAYRGRPSVEAAAAQTEGDFSVGFTQIFRSLSAASGNVSAPSEIAAAGLAAPERPRESVEEKTEPTAWRENSLPGRQVAREPGQQFQTLGQGQFTRLFQRLDREASTSTRMDERLTAPPAVPQLGGGFTELLRTLSAEAETAAPALPAAPVVISPQSSSGPGEFTRIISGSMLREAQGRTARPAVRKDEQLEQARASESDEGAPPRADVQNIAFAAPAPLSSPTPSPLPPMPPQPQADPVPRVATPAASKLQQYIPLLLIGNLFVMLLVLILVGLVLFRR